MQTLQQYLKLSHKVLRSKKLWQFIKDDEANGEIAESLMLADLHYNSEKHPKMTLLSYRNLLANKAISKLLKRQKIRARSVYLSGEHIESESIKRFREDQEI